tara:strand:+ start:1364 stop:1705 length:342 start_codon:yes stop_codon:yes gene_type:complete
VENTRRIFIITNNMPRVGDKCSSVILYTITVCKNSEEKDTLYFLTSCLDMWKIVNKFLKEEYCDLEEEDNITFKDKEIKVVAYKLSPTQVKKINYDSYEEMIKQITESVEKLI